MALKDKMLPEGNSTLGQYCDGRAECRSRRSELPILIKLTVIGQESLGNNSQNLPAAEDYSTVEQQVIDS